MDIHADRLLILDFGSQYTQLIARRVREHGCTQKYYPVTSPHALKVRPEVLSCLVARSRRRIVVAGGSQKYMTLTFQLLAFVMVCSVSSGAWGPRRVGDLRGSGTPISLLKMMSHYLRAYLITDLCLRMSHGDRVTELPPGFAVIGSMHAPIAAMANENADLRSAIPPESRTPGRLRNTREIAHTIWCGREWTPENIIDDAIRQVRAGR